MLSKFIKFPFAQASSRTTTKNLAYFCTKDQSSGKQPKAPQVKAPAKVEPKNVVADTQHDSTKKTGSPQQTLQDIAYMNYKKWPNVSHNDPSSKNYIQSERDEYHDKVSVDSWNYVIDSIKRDLKLQEEVYKALENMDRPYKKYGIPGITKNVTGGVKDYGPQGNLGYKTTQEDDDDKFLNEKFGNHNRFTNQTVFHPKFAPISSYSEWEKEVENRPVNRHFHPDKGYKYDVETPYEQRLPHVADRYGYPEVLGTPFERLVRLEGEIYHPVYLDQPFINVPGGEPHPSLNFEEGEVIYENTNILEWGRFWNLTGFSLFAFNALFIPYNLVYKTHLPLPSSYDNLFVPYHGHTPFYFDINRLQIPVAAGVGMYAVYIYMTYTNAIWKDYVLKMQYSKDKELVFVTRMSPYGSMEEEVFETHHLEFLPPSVKVGTKDLSSQDVDGLWDVTCMASHRNLVLYNEDKYWNPQLRKEFFDKVMNYWSPDIVEGSRAEEVQRRNATPKISIGPEEEEMKLEHKKN